jgi:hypothetical protein
MAKVNTFCDLARIPLTGLRFHYDPVMFAKSQGCGVRSGGMMRLITFRKPSGCHSTPVGEELIVEFFQDLLTRL